MKRILPIVAIAAIAIFMVACKSNTAGNAKLSYEDTVGLAAFKNWKSQMVDPNVYYAQGAEIASTPVKKASTTTRKATATRAVSKSGSMNTVSQYPAKKKGWSKRAKGAAIGGGGGAVLGAVINKKNRVAGGIIGGVLGAGIGYVIGNEMDRKDGRR